MLVLYAIFFPEAFYLKNVITKQYQKSKMVFSRFNTKLFINQNSLSDAQENTKVTELFK